MRALIGWVSSVAVACGGSGESAAPSAGGGGGSGDSGVGGSGSGACTGPADQAARAAHDMRLELGKCYATCVGAESDCIRHCLAKTVGVSLSCGGCYEELAKCERACACIDPDAGDCAQCASACVAAFTSCSGVEAPSKS